MIDDCTQGLEADPVGRTSALSSDALANPPRPSSRGRRLLARVARWQAPPRNLLLSALVLLVFRWDDILIDALYGGNPKLPTLVVYGVWSLLDFPVIWVLLASGRLVRPAFVYGGITVALDAMLAVVYLGLTQGRKRSRSRPRSLTGWRPEAWLSTRTRRASSPSTGALTSWDSTSAATAPSH